MVVIIILKSVNHGRAVATFPMLKTLMGNIHGSTIAMSFLFNKFLAHGGPVMPLVLKTLAAMTLILSTAGIDQANAVPLFCTDAANLPGVVLTGCAAETDRTPVEGGTPGVYEAISGGSPELGGILSLPTPHPLVQVGRYGLMDTPPGENGTDADSPAAPEIEGSLPEPHTNSHDDMASAITREDRWYYMNVDQDGTHILLGDEDQLDPWMSWEAPDDVLPKGIGIGKRWQF